MRKIIQLIVVVFLLINTAYAQHWELAPKIGYNRHVTNDRDFYIGQGFDIGLGGTYNFNKKFAVEVDAMYSWIGGRSFINVPIKGKYYIVKGLNVFAGPQFNFYLNDDFFCSMDGGSSPKPHHFLFAVMGGVGYKFESGYSLSFSYYYNITETCVNTKWHSSNSENIQNIKITFAKYFKLGK